MYTFYRQVDRRKDQGKVIVNMKKPETLGQFEQLVLAAVRAIENAYAVPVQEQVEQLYRRPVKFASVYSTLDRLEEKGYVTTRAADPTPQRGNKPKRYYSIAPAGEQALRDSAETAERFLESLKQKEWEAGSDSAEEKI